MARAAAKKNVFERWIPIWHVFFFVMIGVAAFVSFGHITETGRGSRGVVGGLVGVLIVWYAATIVRLGRRQREHPRPVLVYLAGAIAIALTLVHFDPVFLMVAMTLYNHVFAFLVMRWAIPSAFVLTLAIALVLFRHTDAISVLVLVVGAAAALVFALFIDATTTESEKRQVLIDELERTREQLAFAERLAGQTEERHRIGRELHDTVTQQLVGIVMHLESAKDAVESKAAVDTSLRLAREGLAEARRLVWAERPAALENASLSHALSAMTARVAKESGFAVERNVGDEVDELPAAMQTLVLRGVQEALANARKHARASRVAVSISVAEDIVTLDVNDDGIGFDGKIPDGPRAGRSGFGLRGLDERVRALGGTLVLESKPGEGTTVAIHLPRRREAGRAEADS